MWTVCYMSWLKNLCWNFDVVWILFIIWIRQVSVHVCNRKIQKVTNVLNHLVLRWVCWALSFLFRAQRKLILIKLNEQHKWNFFRDGNLLLGVVGMFSWFKYSGCIGLLTQNTKKWQIVINKKRKKFTGCFFLVLPEWNNSSLPNMQKF